MLTKNEKILLTIKGLYFFGIAIANTFAQIYLYRYTGSFIEMSFYTVARVLMIFLFFYVAAKLSTRFKVGILMILGLIMTAFSLIWMLYLKEEIGTSPFYVYAIGLVWGAGEGLFWFACVTLQQYLTTVTSRARYFGFSGVIGGIAGISGPLLSSFVLLLSEDVIAGYYRIFQVTIVLFLLASILSFSMHTDYHTPSFSTKGKWLSGTDRRWKWILGTHYLNGIRDAANFSITGLLIYEAAGSGAFYGNLVSLFAFISVIGHALTGRFLKTGNEAKVLVRSSILVFLAGPILVLSPTVIGAILHGVLFNFAFAFYDNSFNIAQMNELSHYIDAGETISERVVIKEGYFDFGRITGFVFLIVLMSVLPRHLALFIAMPILYGFSLMVAWLTRHYVVDQVKSDNHA